MSSPTLGWRPEAVVALVNCCLSGDVHVARRLRRRLCGSGERVRFERVIPYPRGLRQRFGSFPSPGVDETMLVRAQLGVSDTFGRTELAQVRALRANYRRYGVYTPSEWRRREWGTPWEAIDEQHGPQEVTFVTAEAPPFAVLLQLAREAPTESFLFAYGPEDDESARTVSAGMTLFEKGEGRSILWRPAAESANEPIGFTPNWIEV